MQSDHMCGVFHHWLISLSTAVSRFVHVTASANVPVLFAKEDIIVHVDHL